MADAGKNAITTFASYAAEATLAIGYSFIDKDHVVVTSNATIPDTTYVRGTDYEITTAAPTVITWTVKPANGLKITLTRVTPNTTPIVEFEAGNPVVAASLNNNFLQVLYYTQEVADKL